jgi:hypothetical protein
MIKFKSNTELNLVTDFDEKTDTVVDKGFETFLVGEPVDAEIFNDDGSQFVDLQFADGSVALSVQRDWFEVIPEIN